MIHSHWFPSNAIPVPTHLVDATDAAFEIILDKLAITFKMPERRSQTASADSRTVDVVDGDSHRREKRSHNLRVGIMQAACRVEHPRMH